MIKKSILVVSSVGIIILAIIISEMEAAFLFAITMIGFGVIANSKTGHGILMIGVITLFLVLLPISAYTYIEHFTVGVLILVLMLTARIIIKENNIDEQPLPK